MTSFYGSSCANNGKDALNTPQSGTCICDALISGPSQCPVCSKRATRRDAVPNAAMVSLLGAVRQMLAAAPPAAL
eukprot:1194909-Prorocentrum_minimum.AAC.4